MNNEELIARLLEGSLSQEERQEIERRMVSSPQFAAEVSEYLSVEEMLTSSREALPKPSMSLIDGVEEKFAMLIAGATAVSPVMPGITSASSSLNVSKILLGIVTGLSIGAVVAYFSLKTSSDEQTIASHPNIPITVQSHNTTQSASPDAVLSPSQEHLPPVARQQGIQQGTTEPIRPSRPPEKIKPSQPVDGSAATTDSPESAELQKSIQLHDSLEHSGERVRQALVARQIGILYRDQKHNYDKGGQYLRESIQLLQAVGLQEEQAQSMGELGILESRRGNTDKALSYLKDCIDMLQAGKDRSIEKYKRALENVEQKK